MRAIIGYLVSISVLFLAYHYFWGTFFNVEMGWSEYFMYLSGQAIALISFIVAAIVD